MGKKNLFYWLTMVSIVTLFLMTTAVTSFAGAKPSVIQIGVPIDMSGPYATIVASYVSGMKDVTAWINEQGGVKGVPMKLLLADTGGKMPRAISAAEKMFRAKPRPTCFIHHFSTEQEALKERYIEEKMAVHTNSGAFGVLSPPSTQFSNCGAGYAPMFCVMVEWWLKNVWQKKGIKRKPNIALITWDSAFGRGPITDGSLAYLKDVLKVNYVGAGYIGYFPTDTKSQLLTASKAGADFIYGSYHAGAFSVLLKDAVRLGLKKKIDFGNVCTGTEYNLIYLAGKEACDGVYAVGPHPYWDETDVPGVVLLDKIFKKNKRDVKKDRLFGYITSLNLLITIRQVLEGVVDEYGWEGLTSENYLKVLNSGKEFDVMGTSPPVKYAGNCRVLSSYKVGWYKDGKLVNLSDWIKGPNIWPKKWGWKF